MTIARSRFSQRVIGQLADPAQAEHDLDQQRPAAHQRAEIEPEQRQHGHQRVAQRVLEQHARLAEPFRARGADVVLRVGVRPGWSAAPARRCRRTAPPASSRAAPCRQAMSPQPSPRSPSGGTQANQGIVQPALGQQVDHLAKPEHRHRHPEQAEPGHRPIDAAPAPRRAHQPDAQPGREPQHRRARRQRQASPARRAAPPALRAGRG